MTLPTEFSTYDDVIAFKPNVALIPNLEKLMGSVYKDLVTIQIDKSLSVEYTRTMSLLLYLHYITLLWEPYFTDPTQLDNGKWLGKGGAIQDVKARDVSISYQKLPEGTLEDAFFNQTEFGQEYLMMLKAQRQKIKIVNGNFWVAI